MEGLIVDMMEMTNQKCPLIRRGVVKVAAILAVTLLNPRGPLKPAASPAVKNAERFGFQADLRHLVPKASKQPSSDRAPAMNLPAPKPPLPTGVNMLEMGHPSDFGAVRRLLKSPI